MKKQINQFNYIALFILLFICNSSFAQIESYEQIALDYFCNRITTVYPKVADSGIIFNGYTTSEYTSALDAKICDEDLNYLLYPIPDSTFLDSIDDATNRIKAREVKLVKNHRILNFKHKSSFELFIENAIKYKNSIYVKCEMLNDLNSSYILILKIDKTSKFPIKEYSLFLEYGINRY